MPSVLRSRGGREVACRPLGHGELRGETETGARGTLPGDPAGFPSLSACGDVSHSARPGDGLWGLGLGRLGETALSVGRAPAAAARCVLPHTSEEGARSRKRHVTRQPRTSPPSRHVGGPGGGGAQATPPRGSAKWDGLRGFAFVDRLPIRVTWRGTARFTQTLSSLNACDSGAVEVRSMCSQAAEVTSGVRSGSLLNTMTFEWPSPNRPGREACAALPVLGAGSPRWSACPLGSGVVMAHGASWQGLPKSLAEIPNTELNFSFFCLLTFLTPACPRLTDGSLWMREKGVQRSRQCLHCPPPRDRHTWP